MEEKDTAKDGDADCSSFAEWGSIIAEVQDCLPAIDSDSELSTMTEDSDAELPVFQRKVATFDASDSENSEKSFSRDLPLRKKWPEPIDQQETSALNSEGYASATSSSPTSATSSATSKSTSNEERSSASLSASGTNDDTTTLLFQRLHNHLERNVHTAQDDKDDLRLTDLDLELPIYEDEGVTFLDANAEKSKDFSPLPLDMQKDFTSAGGSEDESGPDLDRNQFVDEAEDHARTDAKAPVLSLKGLEGFDLDELLDDLAESDSLRFGGSVSPRGSSDEASAPDDAATGTELMSQLIGLSKGQYGKSDIDILRERSEGKSSSLAAKNEISSWKKLEEILEKSDVEEINESKTKVQSEKHRKPTTVSCGVSACFPTNDPVQNESGELTLSEPTTIFLDLRPKDEDLNKKQQTKPEAEQDVTKNAAKKGASHFQAQQSTGEPHKCDVVKQRVTRLSKVKTMTQEDESDSASDENDDSYEEWRAIRNRIKQRSSLTAAASPKGRGSNHPFRDVSDDLKLEEVGTEPPIFESGLNEPRVQSPSAEGDQPKSFGENMSDIEPIDTVETATHEKLLNGGAPEEEVAAATKILEEICKSDSPGMYGSQRLKNKPPCDRKVLEGRKEKGKSALRTGSPKRDKGRVTVSFAEEPKKGATF